MHLGLSTWTRMDLRGCYIQSSVAALHMGLIDFIVEVVKKVYTWADWDYDLVAAHKVRALSVSWAYSNQVQLEDILAAVFWLYTGVRALSVSWAYRNQVQLEDILAAVFWLYTGVRALSASWAYSNQVQLEDILAAVFWLYTIVKALSASWAYSNQVQLEDILAAVFWLYTGVRALSVSWAYSNHVFPDFPFFLMPGIGKFVIVCHLDWHSVQWCLDSARIGAGSSETKSYLGYA